VWNPVELHVFQKPSVRYIFRVNHSCLLSIVMVEFKAQTTVTFKYIKR